MNKTIVKPYSTNHKMYLSLIGIFLFTLFISFLIPEEKSRCCKITAEIIKNLSYGCVASTVVAWLIDYVNIKNQNKKANSIYEAVYAELKFHIVGFIEVWSGCCKIAFKEHGYDSEKHRWFEWYEIFKDKFSALEPTRQSHIFEFLIDQLTEEVNAVCRSLERIQTQHYVLRINDVINQELERILEDFRFEFHMLEAELSEAEITEQFWKSMEAITKDIIRYIYAWKDIAFYNNVYFYPRQFWNDSTELYLAIHYQEIMEGKKGKIKRMLAVLFHRCSNK